MNNNKNNEYRLQFLGKRPEQTNAHHTERTQVVTAYSRGEAEDKLKEKFIVKEIYD